MQELVVFRDTANLTKEEKFKVLVERRSYGSPVDISGLPKTYSHLCDRLQQFYRDFLISMNDASVADFPAGDIYLGITDKANVNAVAFRGDSEHDEFIAIFAATIYHCFDDFLALFASPNFLPELGAPASETLEDSELKEYLNRTTSSGFLQVIPKDTIRLECAKLFAWLALKRIFLHEVGHIVLGHLEASSSKSGAPICEYGNAKLSDEEYSRRQFLEAHADKYSARLLAEFWNDYFEYSSKPVPQFALHPFKYLGVITAWEFRRKDSLEKPADNNVKRSHPRPDVRFHHFWLCFCEKLEMKHACTDDEFLKEFLAGDMAIQETWTRLGLSALNFEAEKQNFGWIICEVERLRAGIEQCEKAELKNCREARAKRVMQIRHQL